MPEFAAIISAATIPMNAKPSATRIPVSAQHLLGVVLLNLFVAVVAWLHRYGGWPILIADLAGIAAYVGGSWAILHLGDLPVGHALEHHQKERRTLVVDQRRAC